MKVSVNITILCSCEIAANSLSHSSNRTAHSAKSRVRLLLVIDAETAVDVLFDIVSNDEYGKLSFDWESNEFVLLLTGFVSRTVVFGEPGG